jgi:hypothetical protein
MKRALVCIALLQAARAQAAGSFEELAAKATAVTDVSMLVPPFVDDCSRSKREPEHERCLGMRSFLRKDLPGRTFLVSRPGAEVLGISEVDPVVKGYHLALSGCLACNPPVQAGGERRLVTLKLPVAGAKSMRAATELGRTTVTFANLTEAERWTRAVRPHLRAEYVFQPADQSWTSGGNRGLAFKPLAFRVYDACTGTVLLSQPPSREAAPKEGDCKPEAEAPVAAAPSTDQPSPQMDRNAVNGAIAAARTHFDACLNQYPRPGVATLVFLVAPSGLPQSVTVEGGTAGTALGQCLIDAGTKVRFPSFQGASQKLRYPLSLSR